MPGDDLSWFAYRPGLGRWAPFRSRVCPGSGLGDKRRLYVGVRELATEELRAKTLDELVVLFPPPPYPVGVVHHKTTVPTA